MLKNYILKIFFSKFLDKSNKFKKNLFFFGVLFNCLLLFSTANCKADEPADLNPDDQSGKNYLAVIKLQNNSNWQEFIKQKELTDLNYDLYRIRPDNSNNNKLILAQDPKGYFLNKHNNMFCSEQLNAKCLVSSPLFVYGDIRTHLLLENVYKSPAEISLAAEVIRNIVNPFPSNIALEMRDASDREQQAPKNKEALALELASQARLGIARNSLNTMLRNRLSVSALNNKDDQAPPTEQNHSILSLIEKEAKDRFENSEWQTTLQKSNRDFCLRELAKMEAFKIWMEYHKYKQNERMEAMLATMLAQQESIYRLLAEKHGKNN